MAALFLQMKTGLHIPETSVQVVIKQLCHLFQLSQPLTYKKVKEVLQKHYTNIDKSVIQEVVKAVTESNIFTGHCNRDGCLATTKRRAAYVLREFPLVMPVEYVVEKGSKRVVYVPLLKMLQKLLSREDILQKAMSVHVPNEYNSCRDGRCFREKCE